MLESFLLRKFLLIMMYIMYHCPSPTNVDGNRIFNLPSHWKPCLLYFIGCSIKVYNIPCLDCCVYSIVLQNIALTHEYICFNPWSDIVNECKGGRAGRSISKLSREFFYLVLYKCEVRHTTYKRPHPAEKKEDKKEKTVVGKDKIAQFQVKIFKTSL